MRRTGLVVLLIATLSVSGAPAPLPKRSKEVDLKRLQGKWKLVKEGTLTGTLVIAGNRMRIVFEEVDLEEMDTEITLAPFALPKRIDIRLVGYRTRGMKRELPVSMLYGIYQLTGDRFIFCFSDGDDEEKRPTDFNDSRAVLVWQLGTN